jgi:FAD synthase
MKIISGVVVKGKQEGRSLGFPTANILLQEPMEGGIYSGKTSIDGIDYLGAVFVCPETNLFEIYILDFSGDLYGQVLEVQVGGKIREFKKFDSVEELKKQIEDDVRQVRFINAH